MDIAQPIVIMTILHFKLRKKSKLHFKTPGNMKKAREGISQNIVMKTRIVE